MHAKSTFQLTLSVLKKKSYHLQLEENVTHAGFVKGSFGHSRDQLALCPPHLVAVAVLAWPLLFQLASYIPSSNGVVDAASIGDNACIHKVMPENSK